jgi:LysM repeat protein
MSSTRLIALCLAAAALLVVPAPREARAQSITHKASPGDTLQLLAAEYYGDRRHAVFIMVANNLAHPRKLKKGEPIKIPIGQDVTVKAGDSWESVAAQYLGHKDRGPFLARFNGVDPESSLAAGAAVRIPLRVTHKAVARVSLEQLAANYLGDRNKAEILKTYNFLDRDQLEPGESIVVPIQRVRVRAEKLPAPDAESQARINKRREMLELAQRSLPDARAAWRQGDYALIRNELTKIDTDYLDADWAVELGMLLGSAYIAYDDKDSALATFKKVLERQPNHMLSKVEYSPKICEVWTAAGGELVEPTRE